MDEHITTWEPWPVEVTHLTGPESAVMEEPGDLDLEPPWRIVGFAGRGK